MTGFRKMASWLGIEALLAGLLVPFGAAGADSSDSAASDVALGKPAFTDSLQSSEYSPSLAFDGIDRGTEVGDDHYQVRWASTGGAQSAWIYTDLQANYNISSIRISWEYAFAKSYQIQVAADGADPSQDDSWTTVYSTTSSDGGIDDAAFDETTARYVRLVMTERGTQ